MYREAQKHFKKADPKLHKASLEFEIENISASTDLFRDICWTIIGQQLSGKAADTIFGRFELLVTNKILTPEKVLKISDEHMRGAGLSGAKSRAIKNLAEKVISKEVNITALPTKKDSEVLEELMKVKGIGPWTAEMILMFSLGRMDVFSQGDLGLQKGLMHLYGLKKLPSEKKITAMTDKWSPFRTYGARILWRIADKKKMRIARKRGFTLIELLVVISIIGLLGSVVLAALNSARNKGSIAAGLTFSNHMRSALSTNSTNAYPVAYFDFNNAGATAGTVSNLGTANGTVTGYNVTGVADTTLHNSGKYLQTTGGYPFQWGETGASTVSAAIASLNFTMATWVNLATSGTCTAQCGFVSNGVGNNASGATSVRMSGSSLQGMIENTVVISYTPNFQVGSWYHVAMSVANFGANAKIALYINGRQIASNSVATSSLTLGTPNSGFSLGGACCLGDYSVNVGSLFDDAAFYDSTLLASDIEKIYAHERLKFARR